MLVEIVSDIVCPWCFIGLRRLDAALAEIRRERPDFACTKRWLPFFLNPDTPPEGEPYLPFLDRKFGGRTNVEALFERIREAGRPYGVDYAFERIPLRANTLRAHRLIHWAQEQDSAQDSIERLVERLFVAQFQRGEYVGDIELLADIAAECGFDRAAAWRCVSTEEGADAVRALAADIRAAGIAQVPTFIVDRRIVVVGAEDPMRLVEAIRRAEAAG